MSRVERFLEKIGELGKGEKDRVKDMILRKIDEKWSKGEFKEKEFLDDRRGWVVKTVATYVCLLRRDEAYGSWIIEVYVTPDKDIILHKYWQSLSGLVEAEHTVKQMSLSEFRKLLPKLLKHYTLITYPPYWK